MNIGDQLYQLCSAARNSLFRQGELSQLTYGAFDIAATSLQESKDDEVTFTFPLGLRPDRQPIRGSATYKKDALLDQYRYLAFHQLSVNAILQLVAITEALLGDVVRALVAKYPQKLGGKRTIPLHTVLESSSIEEIHLRAADALLNELAYKSPTEFAESLQSLISLNLLECPAFHRYIEVKATRDIYVHNRGTANETYVRKAGTHARCQAGLSLPVDIQYFLEAYEQCIQLTEWLERELHARWHSAEYEAYQSRMQAKNEAEPDTAA